MGIIAGVIWIPMQEIGHHNEVTERSNFVGYLPSRDKRVHVTSVTDEEYSIITTKNLMQFKNPFDKF